MTIKSIGIVGCGTIGKALVKAAEDGRLAVRIAGITSRTEKSAREFLAGLKNPPPPQTARKWGAGAHASP